MLGIAKYTVHEPKLLQNGTVWGEVTEYHDLRQDNPDMAVIGTGTVENVARFYFDNDNGNTANNNLVPAKMISETVSLEGYKVGYDVEIIGNGSDDDDEKKSTDGNDDNDSKTIKKEREEPKPITRLEMQLELANENNQSSKKKNTANNDKDDDDDNDVTSYYLVHKDFAFPIAAKFYDPSHIVEPFKSYEYELVSFFQESNNNNDDDGNGNDSKEDIKEPITESGFIKITVPKDDDEDSGDDNSNTQNNSTDDKEGSKNNNDDDSGDDDNSKDKENSDDKNQADSNDGDGSGSDNDNTDDKNDSDKTAIEKEETDSQPDYTGLVMVVLMMAGIGAAFVVFKKFRKGGISSLHLSRKPKTSKDEGISSTIQYEKKVTVEISEKTK